MPVIKYKGIMEQIMKKPVFTPKDLHNEKIPENYSKKLLFTLTRSGKIKRIERGKYTCLDDPIAVAAHITEPCYLTLWTAMSIRGVTTQIPFAVEVATSRKRFKKKIIFQNTPIIFYTINPKMMFGYENIIWKDEIRIPVAKPEKIVIDAIYMGKMPEDEIIRIIRNSDHVLLKRYAELTSNKVMEKIKELIKCSHRKR
ncbi:MAG TPA: hypothetical protein ENG20_05050 [Methanomicrobia archaeon]|nr:hypothetical protein [Methanomicrobia archaeon]